MAGASTVGHLFEVPEGGSGVVLEKDDVTVERFVR